MKQDLAREKYWIFLENQHLCEFSGWQCHFLRRKSKGKHEGSDNFGHEGYIITKKTADALKTRLIAICCEMVVSSWLSPKTTTYCKKINSSMNHKCAK